MDSRRGGVPFGPPWRDARPDGDPVAAW